MVSSELLACKLALREKQASLTATARAREHYKSELERVVELLRVTLNAADELLSDLDWAHSSMDYESWRDCGVDKWEKAVADARLQVEGK